MVVNIFDLVIGLAGVIVAFAVPVLAAWIKINRQIETLETKMEGFVKDLERHDVEYSKIEAILAEIRIDLKRIEITLARNRMDE